MNEKISSFKLDWLNVAYVKPVQEIRKTVDFVSSTLSSQFCCFPSQKKNGLLNYSHRILMQTGTVSNPLPFCSIQWGGNTTSKLGDHFQLSFSGVNAHKFYESGLIFSDVAYVQRCDIAYDMLISDYQKLIKSVDALPTFSRIKKQSISSTYDGVTSTTTYYGSRESAFFIRIYEKGKQTGQRDDWVRLEFEVKPTKTSIEFAQWCFDRLSDNPETIINRCKHANELLSLFNSKAKGQYQPREEKPDADAVRAFKHMISQYATSVKAVSDNFDISTLLGLFLEVDHLKQLDTDKKETLIDNAIWKYLMSRRK